MFRSTAVRTVLLIGCGAFASFAACFAAADDGPANPAPDNQQPAAQKPAASAPAGQTPAAKSAAKPAKGTASTPAPALAPGTVIAPVNPGAIPPAPPAGPAVIPGLRDFIRPDGSIVLPGGVGTIDRGPDHIGIQINTPDGPLEINVPRRQRARSGGDEAAEGEAPLPGGGARASREFAIASRIYWTGNYPAALRRLNRFLARDPGNRDLVQLRSLTNFSLPDYPAAYHDALTAVNGGDVWDWTTLRSLYRSTGEYTDQYRALEDYVTAHPKAAEPRFLLGYHYLMLGHQEAARREFGHVAAIDPSNESARRLAKGERPPQPRTPSLPSPASRSTRGPTISVAPGEPAKTDGGPSVDLGQPAPLNPPEKPGASGPK